MAEKEAVRQEFERRDEKEHALADIGRRHFVNRPARLNFALSDAYEAGYLSGERAMREKAVKELVTSSAETMGWLDSPKAVIAAIAELPLSAPQEKKS